MALLKNGETQHGTAVFAHHQTAGKGQRGRAWNDAAGHNIALSVILSCRHLPVSSQFALSMAVALAAHDFLTGYAVSDVKIKWPNDIYWRDRKAAGILIENSIHGSNWQWAVAGIGVNINQTSFGAMLAKAVSLKQITGKTYDTAELAQQLASHIFQYFQQVMPANIAKLLAGYNNQLYRRNEIVTLKQNGAPFTCKIDAVDEAGRLHVAGGPRPYFNFGEVEWVIP